MKKTIITFILFFLLFLSPFSAHKTKAQSCIETGENCYQCTWVGIECVVELSSQTCQAGFEHVSSICGAHDNMSDCVAQINNQCAAINEPEEVCWECTDTTTGCIPHDINSPSSTSCEYADADTCYNACTGVRENYKCVNYLCVADPNGPYEGYVACEADCAVAESSFPLCDASGHSGIKTAIGCIPIDDPSTLMAFILQWAIGVGGGIAFLLILVAGFQIITSSGNPEKLKAGQELMTSAIAGLILLIFSVFILEIIGVDILRLPGFGQ